MGGHSKELMARLCAMPVHTVGQLVETVDNGFTVCTESGPFVARRAASCLLEPGPGDQVLVSGRDADSVYIIAVLERAGSAPARLVVDGDASLTASGGSLALCADTELCLRTPAKLALHAGEVVVQAQQGTLLIGQLKTFARELSASIGTMKLIGNVLETFVDKLRQFANNSLRAVEGVDQLRSGSIDYQCERTLSLHGREILAAADGLVKVDGSQIHLG
jgi:uncharacterized protein DUF3540